MSNFKFFGKVVLGKKRGRVLFFPTINISIVEGDFFGRRTPLRSVRELDFGIYVSRVKTSRGVFCGALHYGPRETFGEKEPSLEVHLLDFSGDLYGEEVEVEVLEKIRDVREFSDVESLKQQIAKDVEAVRRFAQL